MFPTEFSGKMYRWLSCKNVNGKMFANGLNTETNSDVFECVYKFEEM